MKINFTKKQYEQLVKLVTLGEWMANATRTEDRLDELTDMTEYIYSHAKDFNADYITYDKKHDKHFVTRPFEESLEPLIDAYDTDVFWQELAGRLADRDVGKTRNMFSSRDDFMEKLYEVEGEYEEEFETNGLKNIVIKKD